MPQTLEEYIYLLLETALDAGISVLDFWELTPLEVNKVIESRNRIKKVEAQERASFDYILASLIGRNIARVMDGKTQIPRVEEVYTDLFADRQEEIEAQEEARKVELFAARLKQFTQAHNEKINKGAKN